MGFCVANTKKGKTRRCVWPATVTDFSCIVSNSADWVLGVARLISSANSTLQKTGPG